MSGSVALLLSELRGRTPMADSARRATIEGEEVEMAEKVQMEIREDLYRAVRDLAVKEGRDEGAVMEEALVLFLMLRNHFVHTLARRGSTVSSDILSSSPGLGNMEEFFEYIDRWQREKGIESPSDEEAIRVANEELHAMRHERRAGR
jgi:hypothetical protein